MKFIRQNKKTSSQFSKSEINFLNNFSSLQEFAAFSSAFSNLYNKIANFAGEGSKPEVSSQENKNTDGQTNKTQEYRGEVDLVEDLSDPEYMKAYAAMRADSDLGKASGHKALSKYVDRYAKYITDEFKKSKDDDVDGLVSDLGKNLIKNNTGVAARNALKKYPSKTIDPDSLEDQIEETRAFLIGGKLLPTPENVMDSVRSGGLLRKIDWNNPKDVQKYQSILDYYDSIYKKNPEDLKALTHNRVPQQGGNKFMIA